MDRFIDHWRYGDVTSLPPPPHPSAPAFLETFTLEVSSLANLEIAEQFSADDMAGTFIRGFSHIVFTAGRSSCTNPRPESQGCRSTSVSVLDLPQNSDAAAAEVSLLATAGSDSGIVMEKTR